MLIIGTDEAGYGPNLGPLVISATVWELPAESAGDLSKMMMLLESRGIFIGDSKKLYHSGGSLAALEYGVLISLRYLGLSPLPLDAEEEKLAEQKAIFENILHKNNTRLLDIQSRSIFPEEFNQLLDQFGSKGSLLSDATLKLVTAVIEKHSNDPKRFGDFSPVFVFCDKHGGRNHYLDLLTEFFPDEFIQAVREGRLVSEYRLKYKKRPIEFRFLAKGESQLPIALASMNSKYRRELAMIEFNRFWQDKIPELKPTAGYPEDAKRFKTDIADVQKRLGIDDNKIWRQR
jgi:ribonuclease HII